MNISVTPARLRNTAWQALAGGVKGLNLFSWNMAEYDGINDFYLRQNATIWAETIRLPGEIASMKSYFIDGTLTHLGTGLASLNGKWNDTSKHYNDYRCTLDCRCERGFDHGGWQRQAKQFRARRVRRFVFACQHQSTGLGMSRSTPNSP